MNRLLEKFSSIKISELIVLVIFIPIFGSLVNHGNVNIGVTVAPPQDPQMTSITVYPNLRALSIAGETIYNTQLMWLEDQENGQAVELITDKNGNFVAVLDSYSRLTRVGSHRVVALVEIVQKGVILLESKALEYTIDNEFNVTLDPVSRQTSTIRIQNLTADELKALQDKYHLSVLVSDHYRVLKYRWLSDKKMLFWFAFYDWMIYAIILIYVPFLIIKRWRRKKAEHVSFWSLGRGIYFKHRHA